MNQNKRIEHYVLWGIVPSWKQPLFNFKNAIKYNQKIRGFSPVYEDMKFFKAMIKDMLPEDFEMFSPPVKLEMIHYRKIPKTKEKNTKDGDFITISPDTSNLNKFVEDVIKWILIEDDKLITDISGKKRYSDDPRTEIIISEL